MYTQKIATRDIRFKSGVKIRWGKKAYNEKYYWLHIKLQANKTGNNRSLCKPICTTSIILFYIQSMKSKKKQLDIYNTTHSYTEATTLLKDQGIFCSSSLFVQFVLLSCSKILKNKRQSFWMYRTYGSETTWGREL